MPSKKFQSPYLTEFGSSDKGKLKVEQEIRLISPFDGFGILTNLRQIYWTNIPSGFLKAYLKLMTTSKKQFNTFIW